MPAQVPLDIPALLTGILQREGGFRDKPGDRGGPTNYGITLATLAAWRRQPISQLTSDDVRRLTTFEAKAIYAARYIAPFEPVPYPPLREQLIDFGVNSGVPRAVRWLQRILGLPADGILGPQTQEHLTILSQQAVGLRPALAVVNDALVAARSYMIDATEDAGQIPASDEEGVESRALSFFLARG